MIDPYWLDAAEHRQALIKRFRRQADFAADGYAPTYEVAFTYLANLLETSPDEPVSVTIMDASRGIGSLPTSLLLMATLHYGVLTADSPLAGHLPLVSKEAFIPKFRQAILESKERLTDFIQTRTVQTNETARGLVWVLALAGCGWDGVHLLDIGASAGLNLVANLRHYALIDAESGETVGSVGSGSTPQFTIMYSGKREWIPSGGRVPEILSRTGIDIAPFMLDSANQATVLTSFVWADQQERIARLREGIEAFGRVEAELEAVVLPDELDAFLRRWSVSLPTNASKDAPDAPLVLYNTFMTAYLERKGEGLREVIAEWAQEQARTVLWLQWEPSYGETPPAYDLCRYWADLWVDGKATHWDLGWVQHHGQRLELDEAWVEFRKHLV